MKKLRFDIIFRDEDIIVINKPAGLLSIPDRYDLLIPNVYGILKANNDEVYTVHRLDKETSGIMLFALNKESHKYFSGLFENRDITKKYLAIIHGHLPEDKGTIDASIAVHKSIQSKMQVNPKGKASLSEYKLVEQFENAALVEVKILTGRTHQIRVHFNHIGNPLLVDAKYGKYDAYFLSMLKGRKYKRKVNVERPLMGRTSLHSYILEFKHPNTGVVHRFQADMPKDFRATINQLRKFS